MPATCCVRNCPFKSRPFHRFPKDSRLCQKWLEAIGQEDLFNRSLDNLVVCDAHFDDKFKLPLETKPRSNLKRNVYPTKHLGERSLQTICSAPAQEPLSFSQASAAQDLELFVPDVAFEIEVSSEDMAENLGKLELKSVDPQKGGKPQSFLTGAGSNNREKGLENVDDKVREQLSSTVVDVGVDESTGESAVSNILVSNKTVALDEKRGKHSVGGNSHTLGQATSPLLRQIRVHGRKTGLSDKENRAPNGQTDPTSITLQSENGGSASQGSKSSHSVKVISKSHTYCIQAKNLKKLANNMVSFAGKLEKKNLSNEKHLKEIIEFAGSEKFIKGQINKISYKFLMSQITQQRKKPRGRRYTLQDKIFALSLMKQGPKLYRLLNKVFALPSRKTLCETLKKASLSPGINRQIIKNLQIKANKMKPLAKYCMLEFDETALTPGLTYNKMEDCIEGIEDSGDRKPKFADHVMVFMLRGIATKWKQPVAHFFVRSTMGKVEIAKNVRDIIKLVHESGLRVIGTVCDQYSSSAVNYLIEQSKADFLRSNKDKEYKSRGFFVENKEVIPIFDVPHLLKGIRNGLLKNNCQFQWKKGTQVASWKHIVQFYELDTGDYDTKMCNRLTDAHVYEEKMRKMNVRCAAQVFSQRVSASMRAITNYAKDRLPEDAKDTADFILFMDKVFDSLNGTALKAEYAKPLRCAVQENSPHVNFYDEAIKVFSTMQFLTVSGSKQIPSITNFIKTLKGVKEIWKICQKEGFTFLCTRNLNQDPLENFFGMIKSYGYRNVHPTCSSFQSSYKSLIVNNFFSYHSPSANCEEDFCEAGITFFESFLKSPEDILKPASHDDSSLMTNLKNNFKPKTQRNIVVLQQNSYIAGYLGKKVMKQVEGCAKCGGQIKATKNEPHHKYINFRNYTNPYGKALFKPNAYFFYLFNLCTEVLHHFLPKIYHKLSLRKKLIALCKEYIIPIFSCDQHDLLSTFLTIFVNFYLFTWTKNINLILKGHSTKTNDDVKKEALEYFKKHKARKMKMAQTKQTNN